MRSLRNHRSYWAFLGHRLSGLALGLFLPLHFLVLGLALEDAARLDATLELSRLWWIKLAEWGLVFFLCLHLAFGLRLLALEFFSWRSNHNARLSWVTWGTGISFLVALFFLVMAQ